MSGELLLNRGALITYSTGQISLRIGQFIRVKAELGFCYREIVRAGVPHAGLSKGESA
jgi:hypothetical protein